MIKKNKEKSYFAGHKLESSNPIPMQR